MRRALAVLSLLPLTACAHAAAGPAAPDPQPEPPNARAKLYGDCLAQAARAGSYDRLGRHLRLTCTAEPAEALFAAMETYARTRGTVSVVDGLETRGLTSTTVNDRCWRRADVTSCLIVVPVGGFLDPGNDVAPAKARGG